MELTLECDYQREAANQTRFRALIADDPHFIVPQVIPELSTKRVRTTELISGLTVDEVANADQKTRNKVARRLLKLCLRELFEFRFLQTDPNWSNFFYDHATGKV